MDLKRMTLERLSDRQEKLFSDAHAWLSQEETVTISKYPAELTAFRAAHLWRVRRQTSQLRGGQLIGVEALLSRLEVLTPQKKLEQLSFTGGGHAGSVLFEKTSGSIVGLVMTDSGQH